MKENMLKKSFLIVLIQATGLILSLVSVYLVAGDMGPEVYSLLGINAVVSGIIGTFSHLGVETAMGREALYWMHNGDMDKVQEYATQSILSRCIGFVMLAPIAFAYLAYVNYAKYDGQYTLLFFLFFIGSCIRALNQAMSLIIRAQGGFVFSQIVNTLNGDIMGVAAILIYVFWGGKVYFIFIALSSVPVVFVYLSNLKKNLKRRFWQIKPTFQKIKETRYLWLKSYMDYLKAEADSLLVSLLFPPIIMGNYSIYKKFERIFKQFIEGFFDVLCQRQVEYKCNPPALKAQEKNINIVRWVAIAIIIAGGVVFSFNPDYFINLINLGKYSSMELIVYASLLVAVLYLVGKYEINAISFFAPSKTIFKMGIAVFVLTIVSYLSLVILPSLEGALLQRVLTWGGSSLIALLLFRPRREKYYSSIYR